MTLLILAIVLGIYVLRLTASLLNLRSLRPEPPEEFRELAADGVYQRGQDYTRAKTRDALVEETVSLAAFLLFWFAGGFAMLDAWSRGWGLGPIATGTLVIVMLAALRWLLELPFELHHTFGTETRFGFNRTTPKIFITDTLKSLLLAAAIGLPLLAGLLWLFARWPDAWLWGWLGFSAVMLALAFLAPSLLLPLFNKFEPMPDGPLRAGIEKLAEKCGFPLGGLFVMDGSKRSTKANAFFTGFGRNRRIALYDTLIERHSHGELLAVLAHEIGHFRLRHVWQQLGAALLANGLLFFLLGYALRTPEIYRAFGLSGEAPLPLHFGLVFFLVLYSPIGQILSILRNILSRRHEFQADAYAAAATGGAKELATALKKLSTDSLSNLTPHPLVVWLDHSHPPVVERLRALARLGSSH
jgi:STE24 endopeptidase